MQNVVLYEVNENYFYFINILNETKHKKIMKELSKLKEKHDGFVFYNDTDSKIYNKDYSEANFCGNACLILNHIYKDTNKQFHSINSNIFKLHNEQNKITINKKITQTIIGNYVYVNVFNDHILSKEEFLNKKFLLTKGKHLMSKYKANIGFFTIESENHINLLTYEKGVGFTGSCGTNSIAIASYAKIFSKHNKYFIKSQQNNLIVEFISDNIITYSSSIYPNKISVHYI